MGKLQPSLLAFDLGGTKFTCAWADEAGLIRKQTRRKTNRKAGAAGGLAALIAMGHQLAGDALSSGYRIKRIGVGFGGPVDFATGTVLLSHHVPGWEQIPLRTLLEKEFQVPVVLDNDANAGALGEALFGAGRGHRDLLYVNLGTGIGGGVLCDGRLLRGANGNAGEIGHTLVYLKGPRCTCGRRGCVESVASGLALAQAWGTPTAVPFFAALRKGDPRARRLFRRAITALSIGIANGISLVNPSLVIIGGGLSEIGSLLMDPLRQTIIRYGLDFSCRDLQIVPAQLGYNAGIQGAIALALEGRSLD